MADKVAEENSINDNSSEMVPDIIEEVEGFEISNESQSSLASPEPVCTTPCDLDNTPSGPSLKRKYSSSKSKNFDERMKLLKEIAEKNRKPVIQPEQDINDLFFASMAKIVKKLPEIQQSKIRMYIGNYVGNAEIEFLSGHTSQPPSRPLSGLSYSTSSNSYNETMEYLSPPSAPQEIQELPNDKVLEYLLPIASAPKATRLPPNDDETLLNRFHL